jgi:hypothetical protein
MVTARADFDDRETFLDTFRRLGIDMSRVHVYRAGNIRDRMATEKKKKIIIRDLLNKNLYDKAIMYDDALPNLHAFVSLKSEYPNTRFYAWHVDHDGRASEYHRTDENFADGKNPGRKGLSRRVGIPKKATLGQLEKIAKSSTGERRRMAQWQLNMRRGRKKST